MYYYICSTHVMHMWHIPSVVTGSVKQLPVKNTIAEDDMLVFSYVVMPGLCVTVDGNIVKCILHFPDFKIIFYHEQ